MPYPLLSKPSHRFAFHTPAAGGFPRKMAAWSQNQRFLALIAYLRRWVQTYLMSRVWACSFVMECSNCSLLMKSTVCSGCRDKTIVN